MLLRVRLFDHLRVSIDDRDLTWAPRSRVQRLFAFLLLHRQRTLSREQVAFALWPDVPEASALGTLRRALSDLRGMLPPLGDSQWLTTTGGTIRWRPDTPVWLDIDAYEQFVREGTPSALHQAIALYTGDLLAGWDEDWLTADRERLRLIQFDSLRLLAAHHRALGEIDPALALNRRALSLDPLAEPAHRDLLTLLYLSGDRAAALAAYDHLRAILAQELGVEPMAETQALRDSIMRGEPLLPVDAYSTIATPASRDAQPPPVIGREAELATLTRRWSEVVGGTGRLVIISGEAGIGKSRLVDSLAGIARAKGGLALTGYCYEFEQALPYQPVVEMLRGADAMLRHSDLAPAHRATLARLAPDLLGAAGVSSPADEMTDPRIQIFEALWQAFLALAQGRPLLLVIEDLHWASESTIDWLTYIAPRLETATLMVAVTHRTGEVDGESLVPRLRRRIARVTDISNVLLTPLSAAAHHEVVTQLSGLPRAAAAPLAERLYVETGGNPFFLHEIVRGLIETGQINVRDGRWEGAFVHAATDTQVPLPDSLRESIMARVQRLEPPARTFVQAAAVAGRVFHYTIVQHAVGWDDEPALAALESALGRGFVSQLDDRDGFAFVHHLIQEVIYAGMTAPRRGYWHRRMADAIETLQPDDVEALAHHYSRAGDNDQARHYYVQAGDRARRLAALIDASRHYHAALNRWPDTDPAGRAELLVKRGQCQWVLGELHAALESFKASREMFEILGARLRIGDVERMIGRLYWEQSERRAAMLHYQRSLEILEQEPESVELARTVSGMSQMQMLGSAWDDSIRWGERALAMAERLGAEDVAIHAMTNIGISLASLNQSERGLEMLRESIRRARAAGLAHDAMRANLSVGEHLLSLGRYGEAEAAYEDLLDYSRRIQADLFIGIALKSLIQVKWWTGRWADALIAREALLVTIQTGAPPRLTVIWANRLLGMLHNDLGQPELACQVLERDLVAARSAEEDQTTIPHLAELARAYAALGREDEASALIDELLDWVAGVPAVAFDCIMPLLIACHWRAVQATSSDPGNLWQAIALFGRVHEQIRTAESEAALAEARGMASLATGAPGQAAHHLADAAGGWQSLSCPFDHARTLSALGDALGRCGDVPAARRSLDQALAIRDTLAAELDSAELRTSFLTSSLSVSLQTARNGLAPDR